MLFPTRTQRHHRVFPLSAEGGNGFATSYDWTTTIILTLLSLGHPMESGKEDDLVKRGEELQQEKGTSWIGTHGLQSVELRARDRSRWKEDIDVAALSMCHVARREQLVSKLVLGLFQLSARDQLLSEICLGSFAAVFRDVTQRSPHVVVSIVSRNGLLSSVRFETRLSPLLNFGTANRPLRPPS